MNVVPNDLPSLLDSATEGVNIACVVEATLAVSTVESIRTRT